MGYNTAAVFLNDALNELKTDPEAGRKLYDGIITADRKGYNDIALGNHGNAVSVLSSRHADEDQIIVVGGNWLQRLNSSYPRDTNIMPEDGKVKYLRRLAADMGYAIIEARRA